MTQKEIPVTLRVSTSGDFDKKATQDHLEDLLFRLSDKSYTQSGEFFTFHFREGEFS